MYAKLDVYNFPSYNLADAYLHVSSLKVPKSTLRSWIVGQSNMRPLIDIAQKTPPLLSFINLVELYVLAALRREYRIDMWKIRDTIKHMKQKYNSNHFLAEYRFKTDGINLFLETPDLIINISQQEQLAMHFVQMYLKRIIYQEKSGLPIELCPFGRFVKESSPMVIAINPKICFGRPILKSIGTPIEEIAERYWAGESSDALKEEYKISTIEFDEAVIYGARYIYRRAA